MVDFLLLCIFGGGGVFGPALGYGPFFFVIWLSGVSMVPTMGCVVEVPRVYLRMPGACCVNTVCFVAESWWNITVFS